MMKHNKLVRDKIPEIIKNSGAIPIFHVASKTEYRTKLIEKLQEEVDEYFKSPCIEELADILEVVYTLSDLLDTDKYQLEEIREKKAKERGAFSKRFVLDETKDK